MFFNKAAMATAALVFSAAAYTTAHAAEPGFPGWIQKPGLLLGSTTAAEPPPGIYTSLGVSTGQGALNGPGAPNVGGVVTQDHTAAASAGLLFVPGWTFLGATYDAVLVQPWIMADLSSPVNVDPAGMFNTYIVPAELSWKLGTSGFVVKTGFGVYIPNGLITGPTGLSGIGVPWYTFQPELIVSYFNNGWALTVNSFMDFETKNSVTGYTGGDILDVEVSAIKTVGPWSVGPVAYYYGQVTADKGSTTGYYGGLTNTASSSSWAVGGRVSYNFGPATLNVWALDDVSQSFTRGTSTAIGMGSQDRGYTVYSSLSFRLFDFGGSAPPAAPLPFHK